MNRFKELKVWQAAIDLAVEIFKTKSKLPIYRTYKKILAVLMYLSFISLYSCEPNVNEKKTTQKYLPKLDTQNHQIENNTIDSLLKIESKKLEVENGPRNIDILAGMKGVRLLSTLSELNLSGVKDYDYHKGLKVKSIRTNTDISYCKSKIRNIELCFFNDTLFSITLKSNTTKSPSNENYYLLTKLFGNPLKKTKILDYLYRESYIHSLAFWKSSKYTYRYKLETIENFPKNMISLGKTNLYSSFLDKVQYSTDSSRNPSQYKVYNKNKKEGKNKAERYIEQLRKKSDYENQERLKDYYNTPYEYCFTIEHIAISSRALKSIIQREAAYAKYKKETEKTNL